MSHSEILFSISQFRLLYSWLRFNLCKIVKKKHIQSEKLLWIIMFMTFNGGNYECKETVSVQIQKSSLFLFLAVKSHWRVVDFAGELAVSIDRKTRRTC